MSAPTPLTTPSATKSTASGDVTPGKGQRPVMQPVGSARFLLSAFVVLAATVAAAYLANQQIVAWALRHHMRTAQLNLSAAMGGLFAGGLAALIAILIVTNIGKARPTR